ncbi:hypothetical protein L873DRAFT_891046 [Choiromyces venosus 120613-1]|uniref:Uncharacterized protein n=1 Tax=Choiromyces venosus 120613-1 TaxID=1336337 RepID=A0A3N4JMU1_9PEZI|nr:hypothetical protein L873DRAFT_891046 [Choiromyces venosus 120613-1]
MYFKNDRKVQFLLAILDCQVGQVRVDFQKLADRLGYKNVRSAADSYYRFRRGLDPNASSSSSSSSNSSARGRVRRKPRPYRRKVIYSEDDEGEEEESEEEDSSGGGDAAGCVIKQECTEGDSRGVKLEGEDTEEAILVKSESEEEGDDGNCVTGRNTRRRSGDEGGFSGFQGTGYCNINTRAGTGFEGARFDRYYGGLGRFPLVVEDRALPEKVVEKEVVMIKHEPAVGEEWAWKW